MENLITGLIKEGYLQTPEIIKAFRAIKRRDFVLQDLLSQANENIPLPIGWGQTISQPLTVAFMLELLQPQSGDKVLDIGAGSGWQSALLAYIVGGRSNGQIIEKEFGKSIMAEKRPKAKGKVFAIEVIPELVAFAKRNIDKYNFIEKGIIELIYADANDGLEKEAPFDKIIAAASAGKIPQVWKDQLKINGRLVAPVQSSIWLLIKKSETEFEEKEYPGFAFVPLAKE